MATGAVSTATSTTSTATTTTQRSAIADNFDSFLLLLTTQLQNQNPLDPMDANQFTQQLVQFAGVEQQIKGNDTLATILSMMDTNKNSSAINFIGKEIVSSGKSSQLSEGKATWYMSTEKAAPNSYITVKDENGNEMYSTPVEPAPLLGTARKTTARKRQMVFTALRLMPAMPIKIRSQPRPR